MDCATVLELTMHDDARRSHLALAKNHFTPVPIGEPV